jgi:sigma-B regulation protein RsbU (phosphoserine phosphatase)
MNEESFKYLRHRLRTSINHISGYCEILQEEVQEAGHTELLYELKKIYSEAEIMKGIMGSCFEPGACDIEQFSPAFLGDELSKPMERIRAYTDKIKKQLEELSLADLELDLEKIISAVRVIQEAIQKSGTESGKEVQPLRKKDEARPEFISRKKFSTPNGGSILILDDDELTKDMTARYLRRQGYKIFTESSEDKAWALAAKGEARIDLIILNLMIKNSAGLAVLHYLKNRKETALIPVLVMSSTDDMDSIVKSIESGADDYLSKNFDPLLLKTRISACLERKKLRDKEQKYINEIIRSQAVLAGELSDAAAYVRSLLPDKLDGPVASDWVFIPSAQLGGDSFGYHWIDDENLAIYLLDVSGHGIGAALLSVSVTSMLNSESLGETDALEPSDVLETLNEVFQMEEHNNMYFSIWYGIYNISSKILRYASAGAPTAVLLSQNGSGVELASLFAEGILIGIEEEAAYETKSFRIDRPSRLFVFSDGLFEVSAPGGKMLDYNDFLTILTESSSMGCFNAEEIVKNIKKFTKAGKFEDDISLLEFSLG